jgi:hypothetical protein
MPLAGMGGTETWRRSTVDGAPLPSSTLILRLARVAFARWPAWLAVRRARRRRSVDPLCFSDECIFERADAHPDGCLPERELDALDGDYARLASGWRGAVGECASRVVGRVCVDAAFVRDVWVPCRFAARG